MKKVKVTKTPRLVKANVFSNGDAFANAVYSGSMENMVFHFKHFVAEQKRGCQTVLEESENSFTCEWEDGSIVHLKIQPAGVPLGVFAFEPKSNLLIQLRGNEGTFFNY